MVLISLEKKYHEPFLNFGVSSLEQHLVDRDEENDRSGSSLALVIPEKSLDRLESRGIFLTLSLRVEGTFM